MRKRYFLIDYENVSYNGLTGFNELTRKDSVVIFYTKSSDFIPMRYVDSKAKPKVKILFVEGGHESLDYQLSSYAGNIISKLDLTDCIFIISNDRDYRKVIHFWLKLMDQEKIFACKTIGEAVEKYKLGLLGPFPWYIRKFMESKKAISAMSVQERNELLRRLNAANIGHKHVLHIVAELIFYSPTGRKSRTHSYLISKYGKTEGSRIYGLIEDLL